MQRLDTDGVVTMRTHTAIGYRIDADCSFRVRRTVTGRVASTGSRENVGERRHRGARAFSLVELLVVMGVMIALVATTLPAFKALQESNRASNGINGVTAALNTARALAVRESRDTAVMFMFDVTRQVMSMQMLYADTVTHNEPDLGVATVFIPVEGQSLVELPKGAGVYGCGYGATRVGNAKQENEANWYTDLGVLYDSSSDEGDPWLFPRSDPLFLANSMDDLREWHTRYLDTFIVRFSPDGTVVTNAEQLKYSKGSTDPDGYVELDSPGHFTSGDEQYGKWNPRIDNMNGKDHIVAECQLRPVPFLAVVDLYKLAAGTGIAAPWRVIGDSGGTLPPEREDSDNDGISDQIEVDNWINQNADIVSFNRYTGSIMRDIRR